jgi:transposase
MWYNQLIQPPNQSVSPIATDHANLLSLYIRNIDDIINSDQRLTRGQKISQKDTIQLLLDATKVFSSPNRHNIQALEFKRIELQERIKTLSKEIEKLDQRSEKNIIFYLYLLILLSIG